ncbi:MAG: spore maturation protein [Syntrophomonadaceae bacterium]|jgi:spore maturation protein A|nr:spore maturation protein [Syntrophomonadaceae bacterium]
MNAIFGFLIITGIIAASFSGNIGAVTSSAIMSAGAAVERVLGLVGILTLWLGVARVAEKVGILAFVTKLLQPVVGVFFPSIPKGHPAMGSILMNFSANLLGLGSAATPFGLKAMRELQELNPHPNTASHAMCTFLALNTSSLTLVPATIIALRLNANSANPTDIIGTTLFATACSTITAIIADFLFRRHNARKGLSR